MNDGQAELRLMKFDFQRHWWEINEMKLQGFKFSHFNDIGLYNIYKNIINSNQTNYLMKNCAPLKKFSLNELTNNKKEICRKELD